MYVSHIRIMGMVQMQLSPKERKTKHNWELCKILKFNHINKFYVHKTKTVQDIEMHKIF